MMTHFSYSQMLMIALLLTAPCAAVATDPNIEKKPPSEELDCEKTLNTFMNFCGVGRNTSDMVWQRCVISRMEMVGFKFLKDFYAEGPDNFYCE